MAGMTIGDPNEAHDSDVQKGFRWPENPAGPNDPRMLKCPYAKLDWRKK